MPTMRLDRASNLIEFPLPPTSCHGHSLADRNVSRLSKLPPRSNSIPIQLRSVVVNLSTLQQSMQQNPSGEIPLATYAKQHSRSTVELPQTTVPQIPRFPRRRTVTQHPHTQPSALSLDTMREEELSNGSKNARSKYPITYKLPTNAELRRMASVSDTASRQTSSKETTVQRGVTERQTKQTSQSSSNSKSAIDKTNPSIPATDQSPPPLRVARSPGRQLLRDKKTPTLKPAPSPDRSKSLPALLTPESNFESEHTFGSIKVDSNEACELETLHTEYSFATDRESVNSGLFKKPSVTDRPRPIARGRSRSFSNRAAEFDHLMTMKRDCSAPMIKSHRANSQASHRLAVEESLRGQSQRSANGTAEYNQVMTYKLGSPSGAKSNRENDITTLQNDQCFDVNQSPRVRSQSLPGHVKVFNQPSSYSTPDIRMEDPSRVPESFEHLVSPRAYSKDGNGDQEVLARHKLWGSRAPRFSVASGRSFFTSLAKLDAEKTNLNLALQIPEQRDSSETRISASNGRSESIKSHVGNYQPRKLRKLKKSTSTLAVQSKPVQKEPEGDLAKLDEMIAKSSSTLTRSPKQSNYYCSGMPIACEKSEFDDTHSADQEWKKSKHKFKKMLNLQQYYQKLRSMIIFRPHDQQQQTTQQINKQKSTFNPSVYDPPHRVF